MLSHIPIKKHPSNPSRDMRFYSRRLIKPEDLNASTAAVSRPQEENEEVDSDEDFPDAKMASDSDEDFPDAKLEDEFHMVVQG